MTIETPVPAEDAAPEPTTITCARVDADGVYQGMETLERVDLTALHIQTVTECDLAPGLYRWVAHDGNAFGGEFKSVKWLEAQARLDAAAERAKTVKAGDLEALVEAAVNAKLKSLLNLG